MFYYYYCDRSGARTEKVDLYKKGANLYHDYWHNIQNFLGVTSHEPPESAGHGKGGTGRSITKPLQCGQPT